MKKRLRKKLRLGEFREDCFELRFQFDPSLDVAGREAVIDEFVAMIEKNNLQYGGGGRSTWSGVVQGSRRGTVTSSDRELVINWLGDHPEIIEASAGPLRDAWHGWK